MNSYLTDGLKTHSDRAKLHSISVVVVDVVVVVIIVVDVAPFSALAIAVVSEYRVGCLRFFATITKTNIRPISRQQSQARDFLCEQPKCIQIDYRHLMSRLVSYLIH